uniref:SH3 domain-binding protein 5 n=1 Tax=Periophthalmus magnuspinnatus TaxID=409849 RepID=A0A3B3Z6J8_9GOBI
MEPGDQRESPAGSGESDTGEWREASPVGNPEEGKGAETGETSTEAGIKEEDDRSKVKSPGERVQSPYEEELDPRIQDARSNYRKILTESARKLNAQSSQLGSCIEKARPYYEARRLAKEAQQETQKAALRFERAVSMHTAAREMVYVAEQGLMADGKNTLDPTWQEMLNHATGKVNEAEEERLRSEREHMRVTKACQEAEARVQTLQKSLKKAIIKSKPYFELKAQFNHILEERERCGSDSVSVFSLQTIASDLERYDSVDHLGDLSDVSSMTGEEREGEKGREEERRDRASDIRKQEFSKTHHRSFSL